MKHIIQTRFSMFFGSQKWPHNNPMWKTIGLSQDEIKKDPENADSMYKAYLYSDARMAYKWKAFEHLTIPFTKRAMDRVVDAEWWIMISPSPEICPPHIVEKLQTLTHDDPRIKIITVSKNIGVFTTSELTQRGIDQSPYSTIRLDDDDAFHEELLLDIEKTAEDYSIPFIYSATWGVKCQVLDDGTLVTKELWEHWSQIAIGLAGVNVSIMSLGGHGGFAEKHPEIPIHHNREKKCSFYMNCDDLHTASRRKF